MSMFTFYFRQSGDVRKPFVDAVSEVLEAKPRYLGMPSMAYEIDFVTVTKEGNIELNDRTESELVENLIERLAERGYVPDPIATDEMEGEASTDISHSTEGDASQEMSTDEDVGMTISVPRNLFSDAALENLRKIILVKDKLLRKALEIESTMIEVTDLAVSFPWWDRRLSHEETQVCAQFIDRLCKFAIASKRVAAKVRPSENERFDMRCWLIRLGCSGPDYKELRTVFLKNLDGDAAFRYGRPEAQRKAGQSANSEEAQSNAE